jgi:hypothetical protein
MEKKEGLLGWGGRSGKKRKKRKKARKGKGGSESELMMNETCEVPTVQLGICFHSPFPFTCREKLLHWILVRSSHAVVTLLSLMLLASINIDSGAPWTSNPSYHSSLVSYTVVVAKGWGTAQS